MTADERVLEAAARCLVILRRYREVERTAETRARMVAEIEVIVGWLMELGLLTDQNQEFILKSVERYLVEQYGLVIGHSLTTQFIDAFETY